MRFLAIIRDIDKANGAVTEIDFFHVCKDTYLIEGPDLEVMNFVTSKMCDDYKQCLFPECEWVQDYKYLGDYKINQSIFFNLRLKDLCFNEYKVISKLPDGLFFKNGILWGSVLSESDIIDIEVVALKDGYESRYRRFQIRFYEGINTAKSYTHNNYLTLGYGEQLIDYDASEIYYRILEQTNNDIIRSPLEEAKNAALLIKNAAQGKDIELYVSGGVDSQCMLQSFMLAGVDFTAVLMIDINGSNQDDVFYCRLFAAKNSIKLREFTVDYKSFIESYDYLDMALTYRFNNPEYGLLLSLMNDKDKFPVYAGRPVSVSHGIDNVGIGLAVDETWSRARYLERERRQGCPEFLIYSKALVESFLNHSYIKNFNEEKWLYKNKVEMLSSVGFDVSCAPPEKFTGFEKLGQQFAEDHFGHDLWLHHRGPLKRRFRNATKRNVVPISETGIGDWRNLIIKSYEDGFSHAYIQKNSIKDFH